MTRDKNIARAVRHALWMSAVAAAATSLPVQAQETDDAQTVVVTGSRIVRPEIEASVPVLAVDPATLLNQGLTNFADVATKLPQFTPSFGSSRTQSTFSGVATSGLNTVNLRNLGDLRSLVLINGRRVPGGTSTSTAVDFNTIPTANIERIEITTGGGSAVYGADAVSGVVNIITKRNFEGVEIGASYGASSEDDNQNPAAHILIGGPLGDRGHGMLTLEYNKQGRVRCADRYICAEDFLWLSPDQVIRGPSAYSGVGLNGTFFIDGVGYTRRGDSFTDANGDLIRFTTAIDGYNRNGQRDIAIPTTRILMAAQGEYELGAGTSLFAEINYGQAEIDSAFEAHPFQSQADGSLFGGGPGVSGVQASIPLNNPFIPQALRDAWAAANPGYDPNVDEMTWWQRFAWFNNRGARNERETTRVVFGIRGDLPSLGSVGKDWSWELSHVYGRTSVNLNTEGLVGTDRLYHGLRVEEDPDAPGTYRCIDPGARATGCVPINPFAPYTQEMLDYLNVSASSNGVSELQNTVATLSGTLFELPAGGVQTAIGAEYRSFSGFLDHDTVINKSLATGNQIGDIDYVKRTSREAFVEAVVPVVKDLPFARAINVEAAYRRANTDGADEYGTWQYGGDWSPIDGLRVRAMRARAVRTPVPGELSGIGQTFGVVQDPCTAARRNQNATRAANCLADGVPEDYAPGQIIEQSVGGLSGGNPDLKPEVGTTLVYGFVWTPSFAPDLSLSIDRFDINIKDIITTVERQTALNLCYDTVDRQFCNVVERGTHPLLPGANYVLDSVNEQNLNVAEQDVTGFDIQARYSFSLGDVLGRSSDLGRLNLSSLITIYDKARKVALPGEAPIDMLDAAGGSTGDLGQGFIRKQAVFDIGYELRNFRANWHTRWIGRTDMSPSSSEDGFPEIGSHMYHDLFLAYTFTQGTKLYAGVTNVFDKEPPFFASGTSGTQALDTIPGYYDVFGRSWYTGFTLKF
jgi:iron complex outermembrane receptor protein